MSLATSSDTVARRGHATDATRLRGARFSREEAEAFKERDNVTNVYYIGKVYLIIVATLAGAIWALQAAHSGQLSGIVLALILIAAIAIIGASQHQLGGVIHEATHYALFADRRANELAADWTAAFPIYTSTQAFRLHHLAHHQFVNDPVRDPNFAQAKDSGHWLDFPLTHVELLIGVAKQLNPLRLIGYILARARYSAIGVDSNPYAIVEKRGSPWAIRAGVLFAFGTPAVLVPLIAWHAFGAAAVFLIAATASVLVFYWRLPASEYPQSRITPVISDRATAMQRMSFMAVLYAGLTFAEWHFHVPAWGYFGLLWILPLFTTFPLFMVLREWLQHGNADRGRYTNSRIFRVNPLIRYAVFPWGMDIHVPHHLYASVPHYRLAALHERLMRDPEYAAECVVVEGWSRHRGEGLPTVVDVLGPDYAPAHDEVHIDDATLERAEIKDRAGIDRHAAASRAAGGG